MKNVVIAGYTRSPFTLAGKGALQKVRPDELAAEVIKGLIGKTGVKAEDIEDLILGCAFPEAEQGFNMARLVAFLAELPLSVAGATVNRFCGSSMYAIHMAAGAIKMNAGEVFVCAGVESMTRVPIMGYNPMPHPGLYERFPQAYISMGETAENVATKYQITREAQEAFAVQSQSKAAAAQEAGKLDDEIIPIKSNGTVVDADGCIRPETTAEGLSELKPAFERERHGHCRHLVAVDRRRGGDVGLQRGLRGKIEPSPLGPDQEHRRCRLRAGNHGHRTGAGLKEGA